MEDEFSAGEEEGDFEEGGGGEEEEMVEFITNGEYLMNKPLLNPFCCVLSDKRRPACPLGGEDHHTLHDHCPNTRERARVLGTRALQIKEVEVQSHVIHMCVTVSVMRPYLY